jgi:hypothetical protein
MFEQKLDSAKYWKADGSTAATRSTAELETRGYSLKDAGRTAIMLVMFMVSFPVWYVLLPWFQSAIIPTMPGGQEGPWLVRPALVLHLLGSAFLSVALLPFLATFLRRDWKEQDSADGSRYDPFHGRPWRKATLWFKCIVLLLIYGTMVPFYLYSWTTVTEGGIETQSPLGRKSYTFTQIRSLQTIPRGMHSRKMRKYGPWYRVEFTDGREFNFDPGAEGSSDSEQSAMAGFISKYSGQFWRNVPDARRF